ncbi:hypothetical protein NPIL_98331, partial [Nephila pilipes]
MVTRRRSKKSKKCCISPANAANEYVWGTRDLGCCGVLMLLQTQTFAYWDSAFSSPQLWDEGSKYCSH